MAKEVAKKQEAPVPVEISPETGQYAIMTMQSGEIAEILNENLGGEQLTAADLETVTVPAGGGLTWTINSIDGEIETKQIDGIIIFSTITRAYWPTKYEGGSEPPQCSSQDGRMGVGNPGGDCYICPLNAFGTADAGQGRGKACSEKRFLFVVTQEETLPLIVRAPSMSLKGAKQYIRGLISKRQHLHSVYTRMTLEKTKNADGITFSKIIFTKIGDVENPELSKAYAAGIKPYLMSVARESSLKQDNGD